MKKQLVENVVDYSKLDSLVAWKLKGNLLDHTFPVGSRCGRWNVIAPCHIQRSGGKSSGRYEYAHWCVCECGTLSVVKNSDLKTGRSGSCGCLQKERTSECSMTHGMSKTPEYKVWQGMIGRCHNPEHSDYCSYGEKGVTVCQEWRNSFEAFIEDMGKRPSDNHTIERVDVYAGYSPENCIWLEREKQAANKRKERRKHGSHPRYEYLKEARERKKNGVYKKGGRNGGTIDESRSRTDE